MTDIRSYKIAVADQVIEDLQQRLAATRWPEQEVVDDWSQGTPLNYLKEICGYWQREYDWRRCEGAVNQYPQYMTNLDGLDVHFLHVRSSHENAKPLIITHGWPGSIIEFMKVIGPLTEPTQYGGTADDAFHLVVPSLPGYGFSEKPKQAGWSVERIGQAWGELMKRLNYAHYFAQGGDWGSAVTHSIAVTESTHCKGAHVNMALVSPSESVLGDLTELEKKALASVEYYQQWDSGYSKQQTTRPQTVGYGLVDSPAALAGWIIEKYHAWTDNNGNLEEVLSRDDMLDNIMFYWLTAAGASSARLYWESFNAALGPKAQIDIPFGYSCFPEDIFLASERWYRERCSDLRYFNVLEKGGHFAAFEQPQLFVDEVRAAFRAMD